MEEVIEYLKDMEMMQDKAKEVVRCVGGRLVYLPSTLKIMDKINHDACRNIKSMLFSRILGAQRALVLDGRPESLTVINKLCSNGGCMSLEDLLAKCDDRGKMK